MDVEAMIKRFRERAAAVRSRTLPPVGGEERQRFIDQAQNDFQDFAIIGDAEASLDGAILTIDLRPATADATTPEGGHQEQETLAAMENIANARPLTS